MNSEMAQVVGQLLKALTDLDRASVAATQAEAEAGQAHSHYDDALRGTNHPQARLALQESTIAVDKSGKTARLLADSANAFAEYLNHIAPGSAPLRDSMPDATPTGDQAFEAAPQQAKPSSKLLSRMHRVTAADDGLQNASKIAKTLQDAASPGGTVAPQSSTPAIRAAEFQGGSAGDALLAAFTLAILGTKSAELLARLARSTRVHKATDDQKDDTGG